MENQNEINIYWWGCGFSVLKLMFDTMNFKSGDLQLNVREFLFPRVSVDGVC